MAKVITKNIHSRLDKFISYGSESNECVQDMSMQETESNNKKIIKKKNDGLIERLDKKIYITEDNRQLLNE